jgi:hypothetical protein
VKTTFDHDTSDIEGLLVDLTTDDGVLGNLFTLDEDPGGWATGTIAVELFSSPLAVLNPVTESPRFGLLLLLVLFVVLIGPETGTPSEESSASGESTTFEKIVLSVAVEVIPVSLGFVLLRFVLVVAAISALLLTITSLLLAIASLLLTSALLLAVTTSSLLLTITSALLLAVASALLLAITALRLTVTLLLLLAISTALLLSIATLLLTITSATMGLAIITSSAWDFAPESRSHIRGPV